MFKQCIQYFTLKLKLFVTLYFNEIFTLNPENIKIFFYNVQKLHVGNKLNSLTSLQGFLWMNFGSRISWMKYVHSVCITSRKQCRLNLKGFTVIPRIPSEEAIISNFLFNNFPMATTAKKKKNSFIKLIKIYQRHRNTNTFLRQRSKKPQFILTS